MAEIIIAGYGTPMHHKYFRKWANSRKYPFTDKRTGFNRPFICELKLWSVKMKRECMPQFLADLKASTCEISDKSASVKGLTNCIDKPIGAIITMHNIGATIRNWINTYIRGRFKTEEEGRSKRDLARDKLFKIDMKKIDRTNGQDGLPGWYYTKVLFGSNDIISLKGVEEL